jgi:hypothetical protein
VTKTSAEFCQLQARENSINRYPPKKIGGHMQTTETKFYDLDGAIERIRQLTGGASPSAATLNKMAVVGGGPPFRKFSRSRIYADQDLVAWVEARMSAKVRSTAELPAPRIRHKGRPRKTDEASMQPGGLEAGHDAS